MALVGDGPTGERPVAALGRAARALRERTATGAPRRRAAAAAVAARDLPPAAPLRPILGVDDDDLDGLDLRPRRRPLGVIGPYRSGRTTALETIARSLQDAARPRAAPARPAPLAAAGRGRRLGVGVPRRGRLRGGRAELVDATRAPDAGEPPLVVVIDDAGELAERSAAGALETLLRRGRDRTVPSSPPRARPGAPLRAVDPRGAQGRHGLLLDPDLDLDGDLLGVRLPRRSNAVFPPGRGYFVSRGTLVWSRWRPRSASENVRCA